MSSEHEKIGYEKTDVSVWGVVVWAVVPSVVVIVSIVALNFIYQASIVRRENTLGHADRTQIEGMRAKNEKLLSEYGKSSEAGKYRIPIDRAVYLMLKENGAE